MYELLVNLIKRFEGLHAIHPNGMVYPYLCPAGYPTQGYGVLVMSLRSPPITKEQAEVQLQGRIPYYVIETLRACPELLLDPIECWAAISDFTWNLGAARLRGSTLRRKIRAGDWSGAVQELRKWVRAGNRTLPGLVLRRQAEINLIQKGLANGI